VLGVVHAHGANYDFRNDVQHQQSSGGAGYEVLAMLGGSPSPNFALDGAVSFIHVPKSNIEERITPNFGDPIQRSEHPALFALSLGPSVDYFPSRNFHLGGLLGLAVEGVPKFKEPSKTETLGGFASALWLGFDWELAEKTGLGILMTAHLNVDGARDIPGTVSNGRKGEAGVSLGLGVSLSYF